MKRIELGLERFMANGEAAALIQDRLQRYSPIRKDVPYDVIVLTNPFYSRSENDAMISHLRSLLPDGTILRIRN